MDIVYIDDETGAPCPENPSTTVNKPNRKVDVFLSMEMILACQKERRHIPLKKRKPIPVDIELMLRLQASICDPTPRIDNLCI